MDKQPPEADIVNAMTVDVEDYFQVSAFENHIHRDSWEEITGRVEANTERVLELFELHGTKGTFFILGWVAERYPDLVRAIAAAGHEVASHGFSHIRVTQHSPAEFREDVETTKKILEECTGVEVKGFRAASFSIGAENLWAPDILEEAGYRYSSSIYPIRHDLYGMPNAPRFPFRHRKSGLLEIPITTFSFMNRNFPGGGGGYFRLYPYRLYSWILRRVNHYEHQTGVFYFHPWEIDPHQPRQKGINLKTRFRHYTNLDRMESRIARLLTDFNWDRIDRIFLPASPSVTQSD